VSLRTKLLALFGALAIAPLLALSVFDYVRSANAVRHLLGAQTAAVAQRVARQAADQLALIEGDLSLLAENAETQRLLATGQGRDEASQFVRSAVTVMQASPLSVTLTGPTGAEILKVAADTLEIIAGFTARPAWPMTLTVSGQNGETLGAMTAMIPLDAIVPRELLDDRVGIGGYTLVVDRAARRVLMDPNSRAPDRAQSALDATADVTDSSSALEYTEHDSARVASVAPITDNGLAILSAAAVDEFSRPLARVRALNLLLALGITVVIGAAFFVLAGRLARPLEVLTRAAEEVGRGNFDPSLPADGRDEVGRLTASFRHMSTQIREMMRQVESSRQMAAVGAFSAQIAHEIRNPLTSIKLNLQSLERDLRDGTFDESARRPLEICMAEIQRLDKVVRGVLRLGRADRSAPERLSVHQALSAAASLTHKQLAGQNVTLELDLAASEDEIIGDADELRGVLLNLLLNAAEVLEQGGRIRVTTAVAEAVGARVIEVRVADDGPGVPAAARESVFEPFYSTKRQGSGLGLAIAARDVESHRGRLSLAEHPGELGGATFVVELPLAPSEDRA
jgi:signal transduction histidine kinase